MLDLPSCSVHTATKSHGMILHNHITTTTTRSEYTLLCIKIAHIHHQQSSKAEDNILHGSLIPLWRLFSALLLACAIPSWSHLPLMSLQVSITARIKFEFFCSQSQSALHHVSYAPWFRTTRQRRSKLWHIRSKLR